MNVSKCNVLDEKMNVNQRNKVYSKIASWSSEKRAKAFGNEAKYVLVGRTVGHAVGGVRRIKRWIEYSYELQGGTCLGISLNPNGNCPCSLLQGIRIHGTYGSSNRIGSSVCSFCCYYMFSSN